MAFKLAVEDLKFIADQVAKTVANTALSLEDLGFTKLQIKQARAVHITVESYSIRYRFGTAPTSSNGHLIAAGDGGWIPVSESLKDLKLIRATGNSATVQVSLFG